MAGKFPLQGFLLWGPGRHLSPDPFGGFFRTALENVLVGIPCLDE